MIMVRVLIVDDEPLARSALLNVVASRDDIEHYESAADAVQALDILAREPFDVVLLDINMPELTGMQMVDTLLTGKRPLPAIVFVTAYQEHAIAAFERHAVDYVLKPFSNERIHSALNAAIHRSQAERAAHVIGSMQQLREQIRENRVAIKTERRVLFIDPSEILSVEAQGNYVLLQRSAGSYLLRESISIVAQKLQHYGFLRIHRSVLVNAAFVAEIRPWFTGEYVLIMRNGKEYTVTRTYKRNLSSIAKLWLGSEGISTE
jgi:two-component system LytT family response regulator